MAQLVKQHTVHDLFRHAWHLAVDVELRSNVVILTKFYSLNSNKLRLTFQFFPNNEHAVINFQLSSSQLRSSDSVCVVRRGIHVQMHFSHASFKISLLQSFNSKCI